MKTDIARAGKLLCVDSGEYSDYSVCGFFVVLHDFNPHAELELHLIENPEQRKDYHFKKDSFLAALLAKGLLMEIEYGTLYLTAYSCASAFRFTPVTEGNNDGNKDV